MLTRNSSNIIMNIFLILAIISLSSCCLLCPSISKNNANALIAPYESRLEQSRQILFVEDINYLFFSKQIIYALEKRTGVWETVFEPMNAVIGRNGFAPPNEKKEGDGRTPSGMFVLKQAFGYAPTIITKMSYRQALEDDLWIDDPEDVDYNHWVKKSQTNAKSYEKMKRDDDLYKYGIVIEYNTNPIIKGNGSAIFLHVWRKENVTTEGCVAVSEENILKVVSWLDPKALPLIIMGTKN